LAGVRFSSRESEEWEESKLGFYEHGECGKFGMYAFHQYNVLNYLKHPSHSEPVLSYKKYALVGEKAIL
jgi:hypothetical protein